jgi:hypothetical protein
MAIMIRMLDAEPIQTVFDFTMNLAELDAAVEAAQTATTQALILVVEHDGPTIILWPRCFRSATQTGVVPFGLSPQRRLATAAN